MRKLTVAALLIASCTSAHAGVVTYDVTNFNGGTAAHGLWTNRDYNPDNTFSVMPGMTFKVDDQGTASVADDVARLQGSAIATGHDPDKVANIDLTFTGGMASLSNPYVYKQEGGLSYANLVDPMFWTHVLGTIAIDGLTYDVDSMVGNHVFQFGIGANSKNKNELGGSAWVQTCQDGAADNMSCMNSHHWDLNLAMTKVPEPGTLGLLSLGLFGLLASRRKRS